MIFVEKKGREKEKKVRKITLRNLSGKDSMVMRFPDCRNDGKGGGEGGRRGEGGGGATTVAAGREIPMAGERDGKGAQFHGFITQRFQHRYN